MASFAKTKQALAGLEGLICCDKCKSASDALRFVGLCDHITCGSCFDESKGTKCPVCSQPINKKDVHLLRQLTEIAGLCATIHNQLDNYEKSINNDNNGASEKEAETSKSNIDAKEIDKGETSNAPQKRKRGRPKQIDTKAKKSKGTVASKISKKGRQDSGNVSSPKEVITDYNIMDTNVEDSQVSADTNSTTSSQLGGFSDGNESNDSSSLNFSSCNLLKLNKKGETALHIACRRGDLKAVRELFSSDSPVNPNVCDHAGWTPLHESSIAGHLEIVKCLLDNGAIVDPVGYQYATPLHMTIQRGHVAVVKALIDHGADMKAKMASGDDAFTMTRKSETNGKEIEAILIKALDKPTKIQTSMVRRKWDEKIGITYSTLANEQIREIVKLFCSETFRGPNLRLLPCAASLLPGTTHLVVNENQALRSFKYFLSILTGKWVITFDWILACLKEGRLVDEEKFEVAGSTLNPDAGGPRLARLNFQMMKPGLFAGCQIYLCGQFPKPNLTADQLKCLIELGKGTVIVRPPSIDPVEEGLDTVKPYHADHESWKSNSLIIYGGPKRNLQLPRRSERVPKAPMSWLLDCIDHFRLLPIPDDGKE